MECCKVFYVPTRVSSKDQKRFYELRGCKVKNFKGSQVVVVPLPCPHLTLKGCDIYDTRPQVCREYDGREDPLMMDKCLWKKENQGRLKLGQTGAKSLRSVKPAPSIKKETK